MNIGQPLGQMVIELGLDDSNFASGMKGVNQELKTSMTEMKTHLSILGKSGDEVDKLRVRQDGLSTVIEAQNKKVQLAKEKYDACKEAVEGNANATQGQKDALIKAQNEYVKAIGELGSYENQLKDVSIQLATMESSTYKVGSAMESAGTRLTKIGDGLASVGKSLTIGVTTPILGLGTAAIKTTAEFDQSMSKVAAISGATGNDFDALRSKAREMGAETKFSASEAADAMTYMAMAGWETGDMLEGVEGIMNLAAASGSDLATTSDIVTDALTAFGLSAGDSGHFADVLAAASSSANTNVDMMGETFKYVAPVAGALGFSIEDTAEAIGLMANAGIKGSMSGTSLRSVMNALTDDIEICGGELGKVTVATSNTDGSMRDLGDILADCRVAFDGLSEAERANQAETIVGKNAMSGFLALMLAAPEDIEKVSSAIGDCDGVSKEMAATMQDNLKGDIEVLKSQTQELAISFGDILMPKVRDMVSGLQNLVKKFNNLDDGTKETIVNVGIFAATVGPCVLVVGKLTSGIGNLVTGVGKGLKTFASFAAKITHTTTVTAAQTLATGTQTVATATCTTATGLLSKALMLLKAHTGLVIAVVTGLVIGVTKLVQWLNKESDASKQLTKDTQRLSSETDNLTESIDSNNEAYEEKLNNISLEADASRSLVDRVKELSEVENKSEEQKARLAGYVSMLNDNVANLNLQYDKETDSLNMSTDAIYDRIGAMEKEAESQVLRERYVETLKERLAVEEQIDKVQRKLVEVSDESEMSDRKRKEAVDDLNGQLAVLNENQEDLTITAENYADKIAETEAEKAKATQESTAIIEEELERQQGSWADLSDKQQDTVDRIVDSYGTMVGSLSSLNKQIKLDDETTWESIQETQADTISKTREFSDLYAQLINAGVSESYLKAIGATGPESIPLLQEMLNSGTDTVLESQSEWEAAYKEIGDSYVDSLQMDAEGTAAIKEFVSGSTGILGTMESAIKASDFKSLGAYAPEGLIEGVESKLDDVGDSGEKIGDTISGGTEESLEINSPSKKYKRYGGHTIQGYIDGVVEMQPSLNSTMEKTMRSATKIAVTETQKSMDEMAKVTTKAFGSIPKSASAGMKDVNIAVKSGLDTTKKTVTTSMNSIEAETKKSQKALINETGKSLAEISKTTTSGLNNISGVVRDSQNAITKNTSSWLSALTSSIASGINSIVSRSNSGADSIVSAFELFKRMRYQGANAMNGFLWGMADMEGQIYARAQNIADNVVNTISSALEIRSPSRRLRRLGVNTMEGFDEGLEAMQPQILGTVEELADMVSSGLDGDKMMPSDRLVAAEKKITSSLRCITVEMKASLKTITTEVNKNFLTISTSFKALSNSVSSSINKIVASLNLFKTMYSLGTNSMNGFLRGMSDMERPIYAKVQSIGDNVARTLSKALDIHSPSRVLKRLGINTMEGYDDGLEEMQPKILGTVRGMANIVTSGFDSSRIMPPDLTVDTGTIKAMANANREMTQGDTSSKLETLISDLIEQSREAHERVERIIELLAIFFPKLLDSMDSDIILDDGTLVGKLTPQIDKQLGVYYKRKARG